MKCYNSTPGVPMDIILLVFIYDILKNIATGVLEGTFILTSCTK